MVDQAKYYHEVQNELTNILTWWRTKTKDEAEGGFYGKVSNENIAEAQAAKGSVLNSRILWTFSAAYNHGPKTEYLDSAERAYAYLVNHFVDKEFGGVYWTVDCHGKPLDTKKQVYSIAFAVYGLSEYYLASKNEAARQQAIYLYQSIEKYSHDTVKGGYIEALTREWQTIDDLRLSAKDFNEKKSMNTHLHVLEAYANLYRIWPDETLKHNITEIINLFLNHIIHPVTNHLILFFDEEWNAKSDIISYGHDIEAAWLVQEAAEIINDAPLIELVKSRSIQVAVAAAKGLDADGGLWYERDVAANHLIKEKHWWPQAEAMVGFYNAWQITNNDTFLQQSADSWKFIQKYLLDVENGEWFWGVTADYSIMQEDKAGMWKCPYHNGRACLEILKRAGYNIAESHNLR